MNNVYLGPWVWQAAFPAWMPPAGAVAAVDLRPLPAQAQQGGAPGIGVFVAAGSLSSDYTLIGDHPTARATGAARSAWESLTGYRPAGARLIDLLWDHLTAGSDPDGGTAPKPLLPGRQGRGHWSDLHLGGRHRSEPFAWGEDAAATERVRAMLQRDFRRHFNNAQAGRLKDSQHHRRVLDFWCEEYGVAAWREFVPADLRSQVPGRLKHQTTITDAFTRADQTGLGASSEGWSWTITNGAINLVSNQAVSAINQLNIGRAETDLSSADHYAQALGVVQPGNRGTACCVRHDSSAQTFYYYTRDGGRLFKTIAAVSTQIGSGGGSAAAPVTIKTQANGSAIAGFYDGAQQASATDTSITGNLRTGIRQDNCTFDDFQAADLSAGGILYTQLERGIRGVERGTWARW